MNLAGDICYESRLFGIILKRKESEFFIPIRILFDSTNNDQLGIA